MLYTFCMFNFATFPEWQLWTLTASIQPALIWRSVTSVCSSEDDYNVFNSANLQSGSLFCWGNIQGHDVLFTVFIYKLTGTSWFWPAGRWTQLWLWCVTVCGVLADEQLDFYTEILRQQQSVFQPAQDASLFECLTDRRSEDRTPAHRPAGHYNPCMFTVFITEDCSLI